MINEVTLMGNLVSKPEMNVHSASTEGQDSFKVVDTTLAVNRVYTDSNNVRQEEKAFIDLKAINRNAELFSETMEKGTGIHIHGHFVRETWDDKVTGEARSRTKVHVDRFNYLPSGIGGNHNNVVLCGNLTRDPEQIKTNSGSVITTFGLALNRNFKRNNGEDGSEVCYLTVNAWGRRGDLIFQNTRKGDALYVIGRIRHNIWENSDGETRSNYEVTLENFEYVGPRRRQPGAATQAAPADASGNASPMPEQGQTDEGIPF